MDQIKILVVEDDMIIAADISMTLSQHNYDVIGMAPRGEMAYEIVKGSAPDLVLMDITLKGTWDGIETATHLQEIRPTPIIFLTANTDQPTFDRAKELRPYAFLSKPFNPTELIRTIELAVARLKEEKVDSKNPSHADNSEIMGDRIFVKHRDKLVKIRISDIVYINAESNYCRIVTNDKEYVLAITLKAFEERLSAPQFMRVQRSYVINLEKLDEVGEVYLKSGKHQIPYSKGYKEELLKRLKMV